MWLAVAPSSLYEDVLATSQYTGAKFWRSALSVRAQRSAPRGESPEAHVWRVVECCVYVIRRHGSGRVTTFESRGL